MARGYQDTIDWYNKHALEFSQKAGSSDYGVMDEFAKLLPKGGKVLDAGCGSGRDTDAFREMGFDTTGLDVSDGLIHEAKKNYPKSKFLVGDMRALPFKESDFDGLWAQASLLHFENRGDVATSLKEFNRVLKENGVLFISVKLQTKDKTGMEYDKRFEEPRFFQYFTEKEMHELLHEAGFTLLSTRVQQSRSRAEIQWIQVLGRKADS
ncbi:MAG TPA: class I SAM-dependent methyltransferase [Patescibacteria group bacterium]